MKGKKILAAVLAAAMVLGGSITAFANQTDFPADDSGPITGDMNEWNTGVGGSEEGSGSMAGSVDRNIFHVMLPTENQDLLKSALNFKLDPQLLITKTSGAGLENSAGFDSGKTLYFPNVGATTSAAIKYTDTSSKFTVTNKGSVDVDVSVDAELSDLKTNGVITVSDDETFANDTSTSMYMAIVTSDGTTDALEADEDGEKAKASIAPASIDAVTSSAFKVQINPTTNKYEYVLDETTSPAFDTFSFWLKGASNTNGDWDALARDGKNPAPKLKLTWKVKPHADYKTPYAAWASNGMLSISPTASDPFSSDDVIVELSGDGGQTYTAPLTRGQYSVSGGWVGITGGQITAGLGGVAPTNLRIRITDGSDVYVYID